MISVFVVRKPVICATLVEPRKSARSFSKSAFLFFSFAHHIGITVLDGLNGDLGNNGDGGDNGLSGEMGLFGDNGDLGETGDLGLNGDVGDFGLAGDGERGEKAEPDFGDRTDLGDNAEDEASADRGDTPADLIDDTLAADLALMLGLGEPDLGDNADLADAFNDEPERMDFTEGTLSRIDLGDIGDLTLGLGDGCCVGLGFCCVEVMPTYAEPRPVLACAEPTILDLNGSFCDFGGMISASVCLYALAPAIKSTVL